jgi:polygalacturonase
VSIIVGAVFLIACILFPEPTVQRAPSGVYKTAASLVGYVANNDPKVDSRPDAVVVTESPLRGRGCAKAPASSLVVTVKDWGAKGDGRADDTAALQNAIDEIAGTGGTVFVPDGTYMVDAVGEKRLTLKSDMTLKLSKGAILKAIPNSSAYYSLLTISGVSNVNVVGGTLEGERKEHKGEAGEWGMGIFIDRGAKHITISGVSSKDMWGDGFYVQGATDVKLCSVIADNNRRQGLSIIAADGVLVTNSVFRNTQGTRPSAGIDLEPDQATQKITNVRIENSQFFDNAGAGIQIGGRGRVAEVEITSNVFGSNHPGGIYIVGKQGQVSDIAIRRNVFRGKRRIVIKDAPAVLASAICDNQYVPYFRMVGWLSWPEESPCESPQS